MNRLLTLLVSMVALAAAGRDARAQFVFNKWNSTYDTDTQTQKYTPIRYTEIAGDEKQCDAAVSARGTYLRAMDHVEFISDTPNEILQPDAAPMVVITGGRANFLARNLRRTLPALENANDLNSLEYWKDWVQPYPTPHGRGTVLWYDDRRTQRPLYLVVDAREYAYYYMALATLLADRNRSVRLYGCRIVADDGSADAVGFGAQRVCAVELMKLQHRHFAWILDDNVATVKGVTSLASVEKPMESGNFMALGFNPDNKRIAEKWTSNDDIASQIQAHTNVVTPTSIVDAGPGDDEIMQQVVLWNIQLLDQKHLTFSPYFIESAEDLSFTRYLKSINASLKLVKGATVVKITGDNTPLYTSRTAEFAARFAGYAIDALKAAKAKHASADNAIQFKLGSTGNVLSIGAFVEAVPVDPKNGPMIGSVRITNQPRDGSNPTESPAVTARKIVENTFIRCMDAFPRTMERLFAHPPGRAIVATSGLRAYQIGQMNHQLHPPEREVAQVVLARTQQRLTDLRFEILFTAARAQILVGELPPSSSTDPSIEPVWNAARGLIDTSAEIGNIWAAGLDANTQRNLVEIINRRIPKQLDQLDAPLKMLASLAGAKELSEQITVLEGLVRQNQDDFAKLDVGDFLRN